MNQSRAALFPIGSPPDSRSVRLKFLSNTQSSKYFLRPVEKRPQMEEHYKGGLFL